MSLSSSEMTSNFIRGGGDAGSEKKGGVVFTPSRSLKPKPVVGQYKYLPRNPGLSPHTKDATCIKLLSSPKRFKKAISMEDLTPESRKKEKASRLKRPKSFTSANMAAKHGLPDPSETAKLLAGRRIFQTLMLNAWRKSRSYASALLTERDNYTLEVRNLNLQIILLRTLLDSEKERSTTAVSQLQEATAMMDEASEELQIVRKDKEEIYTKLACQDMQQEETKLHLSHVKKELQAAKSEKSELSNRLRDCEEEITGLRERNVGLLSQMTSQNKNLASQRDLIKNLQSSKAALENEVSSQLSSLVAAKKDKEDSLEVIRRLQDELGSKTAERDVTAANNTALTLQLKALASETENKENEIAQLRSRILKNELEIENLSWIYQVRHLVSRAATIFSKIVFLTTNN